MKFTVVWRPSARQKLAEIWVGTPDQREAVTKAADSIDWALRTSPESHGEARVGNLRVLFVDPLVVLYEVYPADRLVAVIGVRKYPGQR